MTKKLWQTETDKLAKIVEKYTVGDDHLFDQKLIKYDIKASLAHAKMLLKIGVISNHELQILEEGLQQIQKLNEDGNFLITQDQEDCHTAIEQYLCENYGEVGKKIHTGRSRNDQSLVMLRLFMKDKLKSTQKAIKQAISSLEKTASKYTDMPMPGYTHMQKAMPTTITTWLSSYSDSLTDTLILIDATAKIIDQNPLGSASGFGIANFKNDRDYTSELLDFNKTQQNPIYCAFSRGYFEKLSLQALANPMDIFAKFANDMLLFTMSEFNFFSLDNTYTTGSSIMPQKRNYDLFEIMRGNTKLYQGYIQQLSSIINSVPSGYNRDFQLTKKPFCEAIELVEDTLILFDEVIQNLKVNPKSLNQAMSDDLYVTEEVYKLVNQGISFRDAYLQVKQNINK